MIKNFERNTKLSHVNKISKIILYNSDFKFLKDRSSKNDLNNSSTNYYINSNNYRKDSVTSLSSKTKIEIDEFLNKNSPRRNKSNAGSPRNKIKREIDLLNRTMFKPDNLEQSIRKNSRNCLTLNLKKRELNFSSKDYLNNSSSQSQNRRNPHLKNSIDGRLKGVNSGKLNDSLNSNKLETKLECDRFLYDLKQRSSNSYFLKFKNPGGSGRINNLKLK